MEYRYNVWKEKTEDDEYWVAKSLILKGAIGQGETKAEAIKELEINEIEWLQAAKLHKIPIPIMMPEEPMH